MKKNAARASLYAMALFILMMLCILCLVLVGSHLYASLTDSRAHNDAARASLSYVSRRLSAADETGAVSVRPGPQGDMLVLGEPSAQSGYETHLYLWNGGLMEEYVPVGAAPAPEQAQMVAQTAAFAVELLPSGLVRVTTGEGETCVSLHSEGAAS